MERTKASSILLATVLLAVMTGTSVASALDGPGVDSPVPVLLVALPVFGAAILLVSALPALLEHTYFKEPAAFHMANVIAATSFLSFLAAVMVDRALVSGVDTTATLAVTGVLGVLIITGVLLRYLLVPLPWAAIAGGALATLVVSMAYLVAELPDPAWSKVTDVVVHSLPLWLLVWLGLLALETARHHPVEEGEERKAEGSGVPMRRRMLRLGELLIMNTVLAAVVLLGR